MKIGFFTETFLPQTNGVVTSIESFGEELVKRGHEVHIYCPKTKIKTHKGMIVHSKAAFTFPPYPEFKIAVPFGKVEKLDIVHTHGPFLMGNYGIKVAKRQKIPKVSTFHTLLSEYVKYLSVLGHGEEFLKKMTWKYCFSHYMKYDSIITPSHAIKEMLKIDKPITVIPTGMDMDLLRPMDKKDSREKLGLEAKKVYLCLGRLSFEKNVDLIISASKSFLDEDSMMVIAGKGPALEGLQKQVMDLGLQKRIKFVGYVSELDKVRYYSSADAFIIASTSETQGLVVLEAMACGCPVIASNSFAIPEFVENNVNGFLFEPMDKKGLVEAVQGFKFTKTMSKKALEKAHEYSREKCTSKLERFYENVLEGNV